MTWKDKLLFGVPAIGAAVPLLLKAIPNFLVLIAAFLLAFNADSILSSLKVEPEKAQNLMAVLVALGGFAFKQYSQYKIDILTGLNIDLWLVAYFSVSIEFSIKIRKRTDDWPCFVSVLFAGSLLTQLQV
jgi:hypothetical protein